MEFDAERQVVAAYAAYGATSPTAASRDACVRYYIEVGTRVARRIHGVSWEELEGFVFDTAAHIDRKVELGKWSPGVPFGAWAYTVGYHYMLELVRGRQRQTRGLVYEDPLPDVHGDGAASQQPWWIDDHADSSPGHVAMTVALERAAKRNPSGFELWIRYSDHGYTQEELAAELGISSGTVRYRIGRFLDQVQVEYEQEAEAHGVPCLPSDSEGEVADERSA